MLKSNMCHRLLYPSLLLFALFLFSKCSKTEDFKPISQYSVSVQSSPLEGGFVVPSFTAAAEGTPISLLANPSTHYIFKNWSGDANGTENPTTIVLNSNKNITAVFELKDSDGDGITDDIDSCPDTPNGAPVNSMGCSENQDSTGGDELKILFIGSSLFIYNNLPDMFFSLVEKTGKRVAIDSYMQGGLFLSDHASSVLTENKIKQEKWDFVVLQGIGTRLAYPDFYTSKHVRPAIVTLQEKILKNHATTKIIYCMPWSNENGMTWTDGSDSYEEMQIKIYNRTIQYSNEIDFTIAPVGWAWYKVLENRGYPINYLHLRDGRHPSVRGSYIMACVLYTTIYKESTEGNSFYSGLGVSEASYFQEVSSQTVSNDFDLWRIRY